MIKPVSGLCDMRCSYCFYADELQYRSDAAKAGVMSEELLETAVRRILRSAEHAAHFVFQGGEPTLAGLSFFASVIRYQKMYNTKGLRVTNAIQTNGLHLSDEMIAFLAKEQFLVGVSLDGTALTHDRNRKDHEGRGTWERIRANIEKLKDAGVEYNILCVVTSAVAKAAGAVFDALAPHRFLQFIPCMNPMDGSANADALSAADYGSFLCTVFDRYERAWKEGNPVSVRTFDNWIHMLAGGQPDSCAMAGVCGNSLMMESDGSLYPCDFYGTDEWLLGNIRENSFLKVLRSEKETAFLARSRELPEKCRNCEWYALCRNGCERDRDSAHLCRHCEAHRMFFSRAYERMEQLAAKGRHHCISGQTGVQ